MKKAILIMLVLLAAVAQIADAQSTRRRAVRAAKTVAAVVDKTEAKTDTVTDRAEIDRLVKLSGYKKVLASRVETLMITNQTAADTIRSVEVDIDYRSPDGAQLNRRTVTFTADIPPGETRHVSVASWDRQQIFYHIDTPPARRTQRATPFTVTLHPLRLILTPPL